MSDTLSINDIRAGKVRTATLNHRGYCLHFHDDVTQVQGYQVSDAMKQALADTKVPTFTFSEDSAIQMIGLHPIIKDFRNDPASWSAIDRMPAEIGHSILALGADDIANFTPVKLPLCLFSKKMQEHLSNLAETKGKMNQLVRMPIQDAHEFYGRPFDFFESVTSKMMNHNLKPITTHLLHQHLKLKEQHAELEGKKDPSDATDFPILNKRRALEAQMHLLESQISTVSENVILGKANDWPASQITNRIQQQIRLENTREIEEAKKYDPVEYPHLDARKQLAERVDQLLDRLLNAMQNTMIFSI
ncbi:hypothetical protein ACI2KR_08490 [Pseudomonas luteola]